ncbi:MAG: hypothetical protein CVU56_19345 [Deltaproteobacteria bacterium HGW-Deltaproteobacteria-14]|nr:MAG: hypothetical protein CVU56_19345 [Deltaproteobacteria bacterium HGW-Deltaproteobacteria-14]
MKRTAQRLALALLAGLLGAGALGCGGRTGAGVADTADAAEARDSEGTGDGAAVDDTAVAADAETDDVAGDDVADVNFIDKSARCTVAAAMFSGRLAVATPAGLTAGPVGWAAPALDTALDPGTGAPTHPAFWQVAGQRRLVVARAGACHVTVFAGDVVLWTFDEADAVCARISLPSLPQRTE